MLHSQGIFSNICASAPGAILKLFVLDPTGHYIGRSGRSRQTRDIMKKLLIISGLVTVLVSCTSLDSSPGSVLNAVQGAEKITVTGYAVIALQPSEDPAQRRLLAIRASKLDAYRALAEHVYGQLVDSQTTIGDLVIGNDFLSSKVQGVIYGAQLERIDPLANDTYAVTLSLDKSVIRDLRILYMRYVSQNL